MSKKNKFLVLLASILVISITGIFAVRKNDASKNESILSQNTPDNMNILGPVFKLTDLQGFEHNLSDYKDSPVLVHFMAVGCGGRFSKLNDNQLKQLKIICINLCEVDKITIFTILISTCETSDLTLLYDKYSITWILGNDYQDNKLDVLETYNEYEPEDGTILVLDKYLNVKEVVKNRISAVNLIDKILKLED